MLQGASSLQYIVCGLPYILVPTSRVRRQPCISIRSNYLAIILRLAEQTRQLSTRIGLMCTSATQFAQFFSITTNTMSWAINRLRIGDCLYWHCSLNPNSLLSSILQSPRESSSHRLSTSHHLCIHHPPTLSNFQPSRLISTSLFWSVLLRHLPRSRFAPSLPTLAILLDTKPHS